MAVLALGPEAVSVSFGIVILAVTTDAFDRCLTMLFPGRMTGTTGDAPMPSFKLKISQRMVESGFVKLYDFHVAPLVIGMTTATFAFLEASVVSGLA